MKMTPRLMKLAMNLWPPFLFAGIRVIRIGSDWQSARIELRQKWWNRNYVGTHFGGSLFAMTDPFWMLLILHALPRGHIVWDKAAEIEFVKPGRGTVAVSFRLDQAVLADLLARAEGGGKVLHWFENEVIDSQGEVVARVRKQIYLRRKPGSPPPQEAAST